jgi:PAS domain S-box-containing protein
MQWLMLVANRPIEDRMAASIGGTTYFLPQPLAVARDRAAEHLAALAFWVTPASLAVTSDRRILDCNDAFGRMFDYPRTRLIGQSLLMLYPSRADFRRTGAKGLHHLCLHDHFEDERFMKRRGGDVFWVRVRGVTLTPKAPYELMVWVIEELRATGNGPSELTPREREITGHVVSGRTSREIAEILGISRRTVEVHRARLLAKLSARNAAELVSRIVEVRSDRDGETCA